MTTTVTALYRYPIKSVGSEPVETVTLVEGQTMPWDRTWAVTHENSQADNTEWARCLNFLRVASSPALAAVRVTLDEAQSQLTLRHPDRPELTLCPDEDPQALVDWVGPLVAEGRAKATGVVRVPGRGMTDTDFPSISIANTSTHRAVSQKLGQDMSMLRWRSNIWLDGLAPWEEIDLLGKDLQIGDATLHVAERIERCLNVQANPDTGHRDLAVLAALNTWGHQDFSMAATVTRGGTVKVGDQVGVS